MLRKAFWLLILFILLSSNLYPQKVGLVLSGGGAKGAVHIGVIKALEDNDIPIDCIAGTSIGSIVGSMYAMGYTPYEILELFLSPDFDHWQSGKVNEDYFYYFKQSAVNPDFTKFTIPLKDSLKLRNVLVPNSIINPIQMNQAFMGLYARATAQCRGDFDQLFVPFLCVASDINTKTPVVLRNGDLGDAVRASMTFPFYFKPIAVNGALLYDGGIYDNFPVKPMKESFHPDFIIGISVAGISRKNPLEGNLYDQVESMIMQKTDYAVDPKDGIMLSFVLEDVNLLDFNKSKELYNLGYRKGLQMVDSIKERINTFHDKEDVDQQRKIFKQGLPPLVFKNITTQGVTDMQKKYVESQIHRNEEGLFTMEDFRQSYFKLLTDSKISEIIPHAKYNQDNGYFDLLLDVKVNNEITLAFGGNISSTNANQLFIGLGYQSLTEYAASINLNMQVGNTYNGIALDGRIEIPSTIPLYLTGMFVHNYRKYYESEKLFIDTELSTFIHQRETYGKIGIGLPFLTKAKTEILFGYGKLEDKYYQSNTVSFYNTEYDRNKYTLFSMGASLKKNSFDTKQFPINGQEHLLYAQFISGNETFMPANSMVSSAKNNQSWLQIKGRVNNYHTVNSKFNVGYIVEAAVSSKNLLNNYTASILQAPSFTPTPHSQLAFNESLRANQYLAAGITPIFKVSQTAHFRGDFYTFLPFNKIKRGENNLPYYGDLFTDPSYLGELSFIIRLPFMSISVYGNYYNFPKNNWNFGLNIGYLIFGPKFIQ